MQQIISKLTKLYSRYSILSPRVSTTIVNNNNFSTSTIVNGEDDKPASLYQRVSMAGNPRLSMSTILNQWVYEGHQVSYFDLKYLITRLRHFRRYAHALQVSTWMTEKHVSKLTPNDVSIQLELISKVRGLDQAEKYFNGLSELLRGPGVYITLLNCYASMRSLEKAEHLMQKLKNLGFVRYPKPCNILLKMYYELDMYDKAEQILGEMEDRGFSGDTFTYRVRLVACSKTGNVKEMESLLMKMEGDTQNTMNSSDYITAASGYLTGGVADKSIVMLRRAEHLARGKTKKQTYQCLLTLYAQAKAKEEVYRIWDVYKRSWDVYNRGYLCMVSALVILDDLEGAEKIIDEWTKQLSTDRSVDFTIINPLVRAYCKKGDLKRAHAHVDNLRRKTCQEPKRSTWEILVFGYCMHNQMEKAVEALKAALVADDPTWKLSKISIGKCLEFIRKQGKEDDLRDFTSLLEKNGYSPESPLSDVQSSSSDVLEEEDMNIVIKRED